MALNRRLAIILIIYPPHALYRSAEPVILNTAYPGNYQRNYQAYENKNILW